ncbi:MAG: hypothetical protein KJ950_03800 [Proteobacteria bacterium]|nr:hypothetical protein [Pseudomonadota bacterium]MBU1688333.1 hypothetical protein [Pseudomonadota bacterium]
MAPYANSLEEFLIFPGVITASIVIGHFVSGYTKKVINQSKSVLQAPELKKSLLRVPLLLRMLILTRGIALAQGQIVFNQNNGAIASNLRNGLSLVSQILFFLLLINLLSNGLKLWLTKSLKKFGGSQNLSRQSNKGVARKVSQFKALATLLPLPFVAVIISSVFDEYLHTDQLWFPALVFLLADLGLCVMLISSLTTTAPPSAEDTLTSSSDSSEAYESLSATDPDYKYIERIATLFLDIVKHHLGAPPESPGRCALVEHHRGEAKYLFDLQVHLNARWKSRRMTIGRLGADSGSRSKCFYVIYDDYIVVKVPPIPITDIEEYINSLKQEAHIAKQLDLRECIIPTISVILHYIDNSLNRSEEIATKALLREPTLPHFLQVGDTFAYFMDMSKYYFLQDVIKNLHDSSMLVTEEMNRHAESNWSISLPGLGNSKRGQKILNAVQELHRGFENQIGKIVLEGQGGASITPYKIKQWYISHLIKEATPPPVKNLPPHTMMRLKRTAATYCKQHSKIIEAYHQAVSESVIPKKLFRSKAPMEGILTNLLVLLAHVGSRGVALRDLKPDNLLVAGNRDHYPSFLAKPEEYRIGLIDIETAVVYGRTHQKSIAQPQLGGTPQYATPAQFIPNQVLTSMYGNLPLTLHLQDWYGMVGVMFKVVSNGFLFEKTARIVPGLVRKILACLNNPVELSEIAIEASRIFWETAVNEFQETMTEKQQELSSLQIIVPAQAQEMLSRNLTETMEGLSETMKECISAQTVYATDKSRRILLLASSREIRNLSQKWENITPDQKVLIQHRPKAIRLLQRLDNLKRQIEELNLSKQMITSTPAKLSADHLLTVLFTVVKRHMYLELWQGLPTSDLDAQPTSDSDDPTEATLQATYIEEKTMFDKG